MFRKLHFQETLIVLAMVFGSVTSIAVAANYINSPSHVFNAEAYYMRCANRNQRCTTNLAFKRGTDSYYWIQTCYDGGWYNTKTYIDNQRSPDVPACMCYRTSSGLNVCSSQN